EDDDISTEVEDPGFLDFGDVEWLTRKLHEMALLFQSKNDIPSDVLEGLFHSIFPRRITSLSVIEGVGILISAMDQRLRYNIIRTVFQKLAGLIKDNNLRVLVLENQISPDLGLHLILSLWTLIEGFRDICKSFNILKNSDEQFKRIISAEKSYFTTYIDHIYLIIENILNILAREQYDLLPARLEILVKAIGDLMKLTEMISVKCNEHLKEIETEEKSAKVRALVHLGVAAFEVYYGVSKYKSHKLIFLLDPYTANFRSQRASNPEPMQNHLENCSMRERSKTPSLIILLDMEARQPIALLHNNEFLFVEENINLLEEGSRNFSSFKIFNLKGPIDGITLSTLVVPQAIKQYYLFEVSEYHGSSAK
ncbi:10153_t:CDS:2, partial [Gigaspora rosea]